MFNPLLLGMFLSLVGGSEYIEFTAGPHYASYLLFQDEEDEKGKWHFGGEIGVANFIPHLGVKIRGSMLHYDAPPEQGPYAYEYTPLIFCTSFDLLPFVDISWLELTAETGLGVYFWKGLYDGEVIELPTGDKMEETDIGFIGGLTFQVRPVKYLGVEYATRYHYIASAELYKYGFQDKDDKIWEHGVGVKFILPIGD
jgi:hypothetical protein